ncbi:Amino Acid-Polyamine-Organocation (APC) Family [Achlya hypogyna]|uniref:Amino Acid-Polyamine-Organocation (APC) Family n=1 Tax=Achlya hypogyna TaxID=1202772 RepID=A0A1V9YKW1_ACHHY|nr:Amino Acid-Polyamine-Organocation (APC) Family [Achlya hypogyna]
MSSRAVVAPAPSTSIPGDSDCRVDSTVGVVLAEADKASVLHIWSLGVLTVIGGQLYGWNAALATGFVPFLVSQVLMGIAFVTYLACASEVCGKIQFSGGAYGLSRVTLGFYSGFLVGFLELLEYISYTSVSVVFLGDFLTTTLRWDASWQPAIWFVYYAGTSAILQLRGKVLWSFNVFVAVASVLPPLLYCVVAVGHTDLATYGRLQLENNSSVWAKGTLSTAYFSWLPYTTWAYAGIECLSLVSGLAKDAQTTMPRGMMAAVYTLFGINLALVCIVSALPPGINETAQAPFPLNAGFALGLHMSDAVANWMIVPGQFGMAFGFMLPCTHLAQALADSNLLPGCLGLKAQATHLRATLLVSVSGFIICLLCHLSPEFDSSLQNISILSAVFCYGAQIGGFVMLRTKYRTETTGYVSPFGMAGAYYAWGVFALLAISIIGGFQDDNGVAIGSLVVFIALLSAYYHVVCKKIQTISKEEYASIFRFSVMKFNASRRKIKKTTQGQAKPSSNQASKLESHGGQRGRGKVESMRKINVYASGNEAALSGNLT